MTSTSCGPRSVPGQVTWTRRSASGTGWSPQTSDPARRARVHVRLAQAAIAATRWRAAEDQLAAARQLTADEAELVRVDALAAEVLLGAARGAEAEAAARRALAGAERLGLAEEACQALEVLGRIARNRDLGEAEAGVRPSARHRDRTRAAAVGGAGDSRARHARLDAGQQDRPPGARPGAGRRGR